MASATGRELAATTGTSAGGSGAGTTGVILIAGAGLLACAIFRSCHSPRTASARGRFLKTISPGPMRFFVSSTSLPVLSAILLSLRSVPVLLSVSGLLSLGLSPPVPLPFSTGFGGLIFARSPEARQPCPEEWPHAVRLRFSCAPFPLHPEAHQAFQVSTPAYPATFLQVSEQVVTHRQERYRISRQHWYIYPEFPCWTPSVTAAI